MNDTTTTALDNAVTTYGDSRDLPAMPASWGTSTDAYRQMGECMRANPLAVMQAMLNGPLLPVVER